MKVAIAGLGRVGARYPAVSIGGGAPVVRNHLDAALATPDCRVIALIDPDPAARAEAASRCPDAARLGTLEDLAEGAAEVIVLATPTAGRRADVPTALRRRPKVLVVEKPLAATAADASAFLDMAGDLGVAVVVNFHRRFDPAIRRFGDAFPGRPIRVIGRYSKGFYNYASHMIDLLIDWFGAVEAVQALGGPGPGEDPSIGFRLRFRDGPDAVVVGLDGLAYDQFDVDLFFADRRLTLANSGTEKWCQQAVDDLYYPGYPQLAAAQPIETPRPVGGLAELYGALRDHFGEAKPLRGCSGSEALRGLAIQEAVLRSAADGGREVRID